MIISVYICCYHFIYLSVLNNKNIRLNIFIPFLILLFLKCTSQTVCLKKLFMIKREKTLESCYAYLIL